MSYGGYNNQGYGSYDQPDDGRFNNYSQGPYDPSALEMQPYEAADPHAILNECQEVTRAAKEIGEQVTQLERVFKQALLHPDMPSTEIANLSSRISTSERALVARLKNIKTKNGRSSNPARNEAHINNAQRELKKVHERYFTAENQFQHDSRAAAARQYRIVRPNATEEEVDKAVENPERSNVFAQALKQSGRQGQANSALGNVQERHQAIESIARQMAELAQLFEELETMVVQQGEMVTNIEQKGEEVHDNVVKANTEIGGAIEKARSRNRKKWWCVLIIILIIIVIIIVALVAYFVTKK